MWIKGVRVENVGPHRKLDLELRLGSVGVFGANGSGKSTLIDLIYAALTNDFGRFACAKADLVSLTAGPKEPAYVEVDAEHNGVSFTVRRGLRGKTPHLLTFHDGRAENNHTDYRVIAEQLARTGIDKRLLDFAVFKQQNKVYEFIDVIPSVRGKAYQVLNRTEDCEQFYDVLGDLLKAYGQYGAVEDNSDDLQARLTALADEREALLAQKADHEGKYLKPEHKTRAEQLVEDARRHRQRAEELARVGAEISQLYAKLEPVKEDANRKWNAVAALQTQVAELEGPAEAARDALRQWERVEAYRRQKKKLDADAAELKVAHADTLHKPAAPAPTEAETQQLRVEAAALAGRLAAAQERYEALTAGTFDPDRKLDTCPTCGQPVSATEGAFAAAYADVCDLPGRINAIEEKVKKHEAQRRAWVAHARALDVYKARKAAYDRAAADLQEVAEPEATKFELAELVGRHAGAKRELAAAEAAYAPAEQARVAAWAKYEAAIDRQTALEAELAAGAPDPARVTRAADRLAEDRAARLAVATLDGRIAGVAAQIKATKADLARLRERLAAARKARKLSEILARARDVVHRDGLPQRVAQANLHRMEADINTGLDHFGKPFWVEADEDLTFVAHKPGVPPHGAGLLSGGQKMVLAVAFWNAVASMYRADVGMLVLDEPTANLDAANVAGLAEAMAAFTGAVRGRRQLIMVTHADALRPAFDQVVTVG